MKALLTIWLTAVVNIERIATMKVVSPQFHLTGLDNLNITHILIIVHISIIKIPILETATTIGPWSSGLIKLEVTPGGGGRVGICARI